MTAPAGPKPTYLVECYVPGVERAEVEREVERALVASAQLRAEGRDVQHVGAILVPGDEVVFHVFASDRPETVRDASLRASVAFERVVESIAVGRLAAEMDNS